MNGQAETVTDSSFDVAVIGGGPAGSTAATLLARSGYRVVVLEREKFPRFQIGESLLPYNNDLFDRLGLTEKIRSEGSLPKHGAEFITGDGQLTYTFRFRENLPEKYSRAFQVRRAEFDDLLLRNAEQGGVTVFEQTTVRDVDLSDPSRARLLASGTGGGSTAFDVKFVVDASGHNSVIGSKAGQKRDEAALKKIAIFAHYRNVVPGGEGLDAGNTVVAVLRDGWFWTIPVSEEVTSVGLVLNRDEYLRSGKSTEALLADSIAATPYIERRMRGAERVSQVYARKDFSYWMDRVHGSNFVLVGDAAGFFDAIFSTGVFIAMKTADLAAAAVDLKLRTGSETLLRNYQRSLRKAFRGYFRFIASFYDREFLEIFLQPSPRFGLLPVIVGLLAGDIFEKKSSRWRLLIFFTLIRIQKWKRVIARPIDWDTLPAAATE